MNHIEPGVYISYCDCQVSHGVSVAATALLAHGDAILQEANDDQVPPNLEVYPLKGTFYSQLSISDDLVAMLNLH